MSSGVYVHISRHIVSCSVDAKNWVMLLSRIRRLLGCIRVCFVMSTDHISIANSPFLYTHIAPNPIASLSLQNHVDRHLDCLTNEAMPQASSFRVSRRSQEATV